MILLKAFRSQVEQEWDLYITCRKKNTPKYNTMIKLTGFRHAIETIYVKKYI